MKPFKQYLLESLLDDEDELATNQDLWPTIQNFLKDNYQFLPYLPLINSLV